MGLDRMCIPIAKISESSDRVIYQYESVYWIPDGMGSDKYKVKEKCFGVISVDKASKEVSVSEEMKYDEDGHVRERALLVIRRHVAKGVYPEKTMFASG